MYSYYINRGHKLEELINMPYADKLFFVASKEVEEERKARMWGGEPNGEKAY